MFYKHFVTWFIYLILIVDIPNCRSFWQFCSNSSNFNIFEVWNCFHPPLLSQFCTICVKISRIFVPISFLPPHSFSIHVVLIGILAIDNWSDQPADSLPDETAVGRLRYQLRSRSGTNSSDAALGGLSFLYARKGDRSSMTLSSHGLNGFHFRINSCCCCFLLLLGGQTLSLTDS